MIVPLVWLLYRPKLTMFKARFGRAIRIATVVYFLILAFRLSSSAVDQEQLMLAGASLLLFGGLWAAAWLITRGIERTR